LFYSCRFVAYNEENTTPITTKEIKNIIKSLQWKNSQVDGEIPLEILKKSIPFIVFPLTYMCNKVLFAVIFPVSFVYSQMRPIFEEADKTEMSNYTGQYLY